MWTPFHWSHNSWNIAQSDYRSVISNWSFSAREFPGSKRLPQMHARSFQLISTFGNICRDSFAISWNFNEKTVSSKWQLYSLTVPGGPELTSDFDVCTKTKIMKRRGHQSVVNLGPPGCYWKLCTSHLLTHDIGLFVTPRNRQYFELQYLSLQT